jgi:hypothetical protein
VVGGAMGMSLKDLYIFYVILSTTMVLIIIVFHVFFKTISEKVKNYLGDTIPETGTLGGLS